MGRFAFLSLLLLAFQSLVIGGLTKDTPEPGDEDVEAPTLAVSVAVTFPASEIFGIKLINGQPTEALLSFNNEETFPVTIEFIGGSLWTDDEESHVVRNLTVTKYNVEIPAGQKETLPYGFTTEMHPQDLRLNLVSIVSNKEGQYYTLESFNSTVSVVEPEASIFDPQIIFLYFFILACFVGIVYFFYTVWIAPYFPHKRSGKGGDSKKSAGGPKKAESSDAGSNGTPTVASATTYNAEWIPAHHINKPEPRKVKGSSRQKTRT
jgi:hypothetical protein